jgi:hypothetical protein
VDEALGMGAMFDIGEICESKGGEEGWALERDAQMDEIHSTVSHTETVKRMASQNSTPPRLETNGAFAREHNTDSDDRKRNIAIDAADDFAATERRAAQRTKRARTRADSATTALRDVRNDEIALGADAARDAAQVESDDDDDAPLAWLLGLVDSSPNHYVPIEYGGVVVCECGLVHDDKGGDDDGGDDDGNDNAGNDDEGSNDGGSNDGGSDDEGNDDSDDDTVNVGEGAANDSGNGDNDDGKPRVEFSAEY